MIVPVAMKLKRSHKWILRVPLYLILASVTIIVFLYFFPVSGNWLDRRLTRAFQTHFGRNVRVRGARLFLSKGILTISNVTLPPPGEEGKTLYFNDVRIFFVTGKILSSDPRMWREVRLTCLTEIPFVWRENRLHLGSEFKHLDTLFSGDSVPQSPSLPLIRVKMRSVSLCCPFPEYGMDHCPIIRLEPLSVVLMSPGGRLQSIVAEGTIRSDLDGDFSGRVYLDREGSLRELDLFCSHILLSDRKIPVKNFLLDVRNLRIADEFDGKDGIAGFRHTLSTKALSLQIPGLNRIIREDSVLLEAKGVLDPGQSLVRLDFADLALSDTRCTLEGQLSWRNRMPFSATLIQRPISPRMVDHLEQFIKPMGWDISLQPGSLHLNLQTRGNLRDPGSIEYQGRLHFSDVALRHRDYPLPMTNIDGELSIDTGSVILNHATGDFGDGKITLRGEMEGPPGNPRKILFFWNAQLTVGDILMTLRDKLSIGDWDLSGRIKAEGGAGIRIQSSEKGENAVLERFHNFVTLQDGLLRHPILPEAIEAISGRFDIRPDRVEIESLEGTCSRAGFRVEGLLDGRERFWQEPRLHAGITYTGDMEPLIDISPDSLKIPLTERELEGQTTATVRIHFPLLDPGRISWTAEASFLDVSLNPGHPMIDDRVRDLEGTIRINASDVFLNDLAGRFAGFDFTINGKMGRDTLHLKLGGDLDMAKTREAIPLLERDFRASGTLEVSSEILLASPNIYQIRDFQIPEDLTLSYTGTLLARDASFAYRDMPADLTHINGILTFNNRGLNFEDVRLWCGKSVGGVADGEILFSRDCPIIRFEVTVPELFFDEWTGSWSSPIPSGLESFPVTTLEDRDFTSPTIEVDGSFYTDLIRFERMKGENFQGHFIYNFFPRAPNRFTFREFRGDAYGGRARASGRFRFPSSRYFHYEVEGETEGVALQPVLTALRGRKEDFNGLLNTTLTLDGIAGKPETIQAYSTVEVLESRFIGYMILVGLGRALHSALFNDISFTRIQGDVMAREGAVHFQDMKFFSPLVNINASGSVDYGENVDIYCYLVSRRTAFFRLPVIKQLTRALEFLGRMMIKFHITGTLREPEVNAVPLSSDEISRLFQ